MSAAQALGIDRDRIAAFCRKHRIRRLSLFGSVLRKDSGENSDVDVLVEFEPDAVIGYLDLAEQEIALSELLGRKVDLRTPSELSRHFRDRVLAAAEPLYVRG